MAQGLARQDLGGWEPLALVLAVALLLAWFASATPRPLAETAPTGVFSAGRAQADIAHLAAVPHPVGSPQDAAVREALVARLQAMGLSPQVQRQAGVTAWGERSPRTWTVENVIARVPGADRAARAVLVMSHYDSVPRSPGAADDTASVAAALEMVRLLKAGTPSRDVIFAFTDGEEAGLLGAQALFDDAALVRQVGFVVNMDVRGGGGRTMMFQTGRANGAAERLFASRATRPASNSLAAFLYEKMPNDTDFSVALAHGLPGLNYAFIGRPGLYHTPAAVPPAVEAGAVQSLGDQAWAVVDALAYAPRLPAASPDQTWFDVLGRGVVIYPPAFGWAAVALAGLLLAAAAWLQRRQAGVSVAGVLAGAGQALIATAVMAVLLYLYGRLAVHGYYQALGQAVRTEAVVAGAVLAAGLLAFRAHGLARRSPAHSPLARWLGAAGLGWLIAVALQAAAPRTAFLAEWPVAIAATGLLIASGFRGVLGRWLAWACCALAGGVLLEFGHLLVLGVGLTAPVLCAALAPLGMAALAPVLQSGRSDRGTPA